MLNRYKQTQILSTNEDKMIAVLEEAKDIAEQTRQMIEDNTHFGSDINQLLEKQHTENMATIWSVTVDENISELVPPCLPFNLHFKIEAPGQTIYDDKYDVCFNGEFYQNMATKMLRVAYSDIDKMYKALEEAELRYAKIKGRLIGNVQFLNKNKYKWAFAIIRQLVTLPDGCGTTEFWTSKNMILDY